MFSCQITQSQFYAMGLWILVNTVRWSCHGNVGAEREVLEETGVKAKFDAVLAFRHAHFEGSVTSKSDLFFVIALK